MEAKGIFSGTFSLLERALDLRAMRHKVIVSNIANMDTPHYKAFDMAVEEELKKALGSSGRLELKKTNAAHITSGQVSWGNVGVKLLPAPQWTLRGDGNSVDIDKAMADLGENSSMYNASAQILSSKFQGLKAAIQGGNR